MRRTATMMFATCAFVVVVVGVGSAGEPLAPTVRLDCEHAVDGCAGMNGDFSSPDGSPIATLVVEVQDLSTGAVRDVTDSACRIETRAENPSTVRVHCMIEAAKLGIDGDITWSVVVNGVAVWTSPVTPATCRAPVAEEPVPSEETPSTTVPSDETDVVVTPPDEIPPVFEGTQGQPIVEIRPSVTPVGEAGVTPETPVAVPTVQTLASSTPPVYVVSVPQNARTAVSAVGQETLPETGVSLGALTAVGVVLLAAGLAIEALSRNGRRV